MEKPAVPRAGSGRRSRGCPEHSKGHVCLKLNLLASPCCSLSLEPAIQGYAGLWEQPGYRDAAPRDMPPAQPGPGGGHGRVRSFLNQKEANPHVPVCVSCWD